MKSDSVKKNFSFQLVYQAIILVLPLVTAPYLTRVLGDTNLGIYSYTYSIAYYFVVFANLGIARHGQRIISGRKDNLESLRKTFWSLYFVHTIVSIFSLGAYFLFCLFQKDNQKIFLLQGIFVFSALFDLTWLFYGLETFKSVVIKNGIIRVLETVLIFLLVKQNSDLIIYTIIMTISVLVSNVLLIPQAIKNIKPIKFGANDIKEHIKPMIVLSISIIAVSLYTVFDKTLLGIMTTKENVAYYEYSDKIIKIPKIIIGVIGTVMFPRSCACFNRQDFEGLKKYVTLSIHFAYFLGFASLFGLLAISDSFAIEYYGPEFSPCGELMKAMAPLIIIVAVGDIIRTQILIPMHKDIQYTLCVILNALVNIGFSIVLIPLIGPYGAVVGTVIAETIGLVIQIILCRKHLDLIKLVLSLIPFVISGGVMFLVLLLINTYLPSGILGLLLKIFIGSIIYCGLLVLYFLVLSPNKNSYREIGLKLIKRKKSTKFK